MQWSAERYAGFSTSEPWLPIADDHAQINVEAQRDDPDSMLSLCHRLIELRRGSPALEVGGFAPVAAQGDVLAYLRVGPEERFLVMLNLGDRHHRVDRGSDARHGRVAVATRRRLEGREVGQHFELGPNEGVVVRLQNGE